MVGNKVLSRKRMVPNESILLKKRKKNLKGGKTRKDCKANVNEEKERQKKERESEKRGSTRKK